MRQNLNELLSIRRLEVSLKRQDQLLLEQSIARIQQDLSQGYAFKETSAWQSFLGKVEGENYSPELKKRLKELVEAILSKSASSSHFTKNKVAFFISSPYYSDESSRQMQELLKEFPEDDLWLRTSFNLEKLLDYVSFRQLARTLSGENPHPNVPKGDDHLLNIAVAASIHYLAQQAILPMVTPIRELLEMESRAITFITRDPSLTLEQNLSQSGLGYSYSGLPHETVEEVSGVSLIKLNGSLNWFICARCGQWSEKEMKEAFVLATSIFCTQCGGIAYPVLGSMSFPLEPFKSLMWETYTKLEESPLIFLYDPRYEDTSYLKELLKYALRNYRKKLVIYSAEENFLWWQTQFADSPAEIIKADEDWVRFLQHQMEMETPS